MPFNQYPYKLPPLPYAYNALEPYIDAETMHYHHDKHFQTYIDNLNSFLKPYPTLQKLTLYELLKNPELIPIKDRTKILNNAGGVYNHYLFFDGLTPPSSSPNRPEGILEEMIGNTFGSFEQFKKIFIQECSDVFGSGWGCLVINNNKKLDIVQLKNQETVLEKNLIPIILFDVWEHAYYLKYKNRRGDYLENIWNVIKYPVINLPK